MTDLAALADLLEGWGGITPDDLATAARILRVAAAASPLMLKVAADDLRAERPALAEYLHALADAVGEEP